MVDRLVSVGDDFTLPPSVKATDANLPERLGATQLNATIAEQMDSTVGALYRPAYPDTNWVHWGDSMTAGGWPATLATKTGATHYNGGIGSQTSHQIAARMNAIPATVEAFTIPASGGVAVTITPNPVRDGASYNRAGSISGVEGVLSQSGSTITFTRDYAGLAVAVPSGTPFITVEGATHRENMATIWAGRNNYTDGAAVIVPQIRAMIDHLSPQFKKVMVMEIPPWVGEENGKAIRATLDAVNAALEAEFPQHWEPNMTWLRSEEARTFAGINWTAQDLTDISNGITPASFRVDSGHLNTLGNDVLAEYVFRRAIARGWVDGTPTPDPAPYPQAPVTLEALYLPESWLAGTDTWEDATGNGHNLVRSGSTPAPVLADQAGVSTLRFDGTKLLISGASNSFALAQPLTAYVLARVTGYPAAGRHVIASLNTAVNAFVSSVNTTGGTAIRINTTDVNTGSAIDTVWHTHATVLNGATSLAILDGNEVAASFGTTAMDVLALGAVNSNYTTPGFVGDIAAVAIAPAALTTQERADLLAFLKAETGIA